MQPPAADSSGGRTSLNVETGERGFLATGEDAYLDVYRESRGALRQHVDRARELIGDQPQQQQRLEEVERLYTRWVENHLEPGIERRAEVDGFAPELESIFADMGGGLELMNSMRAELREFMDHEDTLLAERRANVETLQSQTWSLLLGGMFAGALASGGFGFFVTRSITRPTRRALEVAETIADGDLTVDCSTRDREELGQLLNAMDRMSDRLQNIADAATRVASSSEELSSTAEQTREGATRQSDSTSQVATAMNQMTSTVQDVARNTQEAADAAIESLQQGTQEAVSVMESSTEGATRNVEASQQAVESLEGVRNAVAHISDMASQVASAVEEQSSVAEDINSNVTSINDVATQTATAVNQSAEASDELARLSAELQELVCQFRVR